MYLFAIKIKQELIVVGGRWMFNTTPIKLLLKIVQIKSTFNGFDTTNKKKNNCIKKLLYVLLLLLFTHQKNLLPFFV